MAGQPSGAGFTPAKICDLARPHNQLIFMKLYFIDFPRINPSHMVR
ncbi:conserved hypothetical protein [delta proteobacterium NaphS2]|nr:conserved hypothetical protein [delta proteobacterium NaphS2]